MVNDRNGNSLDIVIAFDNQFTTTQDPNKSNVMFISLIYDELFTFKYCCNSYMTAKVLFHLVLIIRRYAALLAENFPKEFPWCPFNTGKYATRWISLTQGWTATSKQGVKEEKVVSEKEIKITMARHFQNF